MIIQKTITLTVIDETEQALQAFILQKWQNRYQHRHLPAYKKEQAIFSQIAKWISFFGFILTGGLWFVYSAIIFLDKVILSSEQTFDYDFWTFLTIFMVGFWLSFRHSQQISDKITLRTQAYFQKNMTKNSYRYAKRIFINAKKQPSPFTAIYEFDGNKIHYFRQIDEQKTHQWTRTIEPHYEMGENFVLFFKKPTAYSPKIFMFIDEHDKQNLVNYLTH